MPTIYIILCPLNQLTDFFDVNYIIHTILEIPKKKNIFTVPNIHSEPCNLNLIT